MASVSAPKKVLVLHAPGRHDTVGPGVRDQLTEVLMCMHGKNVKYEASLTLLPSKPLHALLERFVGQALNHRRDVVERFVQRRTKLVLSSDGLLKALRINSFGHLGAEQGVLLLAIDAVIPCSA